MQLDRGRFRVGLGILGALVPAVVLMTIALFALSPAQVNAEAEAEAEETTHVVCDGLGGLTMSVNTMTLHRNGEMTKHTYSSDGECKMSVTLIDASSDDDPADKTKSCEVSVTPKLVDHAIELFPGESGDCDTVNYEVNLAFDDESSDGDWVAYTEPEAQESGDVEDTESTGVAGAGGLPPCSYSALTDYPHLSGRDVSVHGWWRSVTWTDCPDKARVSLWLKAHRCNRPNHDNCRWQTISYKSERIGPKNLSGKRVTARKTCRSYTRTGFQPTVHVNPDGRSVRSKRVVGAYQNFSCGP